MMGKLTTLRKEDAEKVSFSASSFLCGAVLQNHDNRGS